MALQDGKFANEPDMRMIAEAFGRCVGEQFGVSVKLASFERIEPTKNVRKKEATA